MKTAEKWVGDLSGLALDWAGISVCLNDEVLSKRQGKVLFTHFGLSGPGILNSSRMVGDNLAKGKITVKLDLFHGVGLDILETEVKQLIEDNLNKKVGNLAWVKVPGKLLQVIFVLSFIDPEKQVNAITKEERRALIDNLKSLTLTIKGLLGFEDAIISSGGIDPTEVDFKTMQTKLFPNLYVVGDVLDFDRPSGGFSLQLAWTTGYVAGISIRK
jgi:predicted Rossmann fold flavoprotein